MVSSILPSVDIGNLLAPCLWFHHSLPYSSEVLLDSMNPLSPVLLIKDLSGWGGVGIESSSTPTCCGM